MRIIADNPITKLEDDALGRLNTASSFAKQILRLDSTEGLVVGVIGSWGSGKTSFINLVKPFLKESNTAILEFNPWMFSGADQLVQSFFMELSAQLKLSPDLEKIGKLVEDYGDIFSGLGWLPMVGPWIEWSKVLTKFFSKTIQHKKKVSISPKMRQR